MSQNYILSLCVFCCFFVLWEVASRVSTHLMFVLPPPSNIVILLFDKFDRFFYHTLITLKEMLGGVAIAFVVAFPLAWFMALWNTLRIILQPIFVIIQCVPMFALAPIMIIWFGWSFTAIVIPTALMIFFPLTMSIYQGLRATPQHYIDYFRINQATAWQVFYKLQLPWSLPHIFSGLRISAAIAGIGAVAGEWAGGQEGLGVLMLESRRGGDLEATFGALFCLTFVSLVLYGMAAFWEKKMVERKKVNLAPTKAIATCVALIALCLTGCKSHSKNETKLILDWLPNPNHVPIFVGLEKGFFEKEGILLKILKTHDPGDAIPIIEAAQVEVALTYMPHTIRSIARGAEVIPIGILIKEPLNSLIYRQGESIKTPEDLNGKILGYCIDGSSTAFLDFLLAENDIKPSEKRNVSFDLVSTLGAKRVDFIYGAYWNIEGENLRSFGIETDHFNLVDLGVPNYYELIFIAKNNSAQSDPEFIHRFKKGLQASIDYSIAHPDEAFDIYLKANPDKWNKVQTWEKQAWIKTIPTYVDNQEFSQEIWNNFAKWHLDKGLAGNLDWERAYMNEDPLYMNEDSQRKS